MLAMRLASGSPSVASRSDAASLPNVTDSMYEAALECVICDKKFHAFRRKHRCRSCGNAVCGNCARTHKMMPSSMLLRTNNDPVRVCDRCISGQTQMMQERRRMEDAERARARQQAALQDDRIARMLEQTRLDEILAQQLEMEERQKAMVLHALETKHFGGPHPMRPTIRRRRSTGHISTLKREPLHHQKATDVFIADAEKRAQEILDMAGIKPTASATLRAVTPQATAAATIVPQATAVPEADECAICLDAMEVGNAIYTTACGHSFHWGCLKNIQLSDAANADKCPSCRTTMAEMQIKKQCDHPRVRLGHRFCRDCGLPMTERDVKPRPTEDGSTILQLPPPPPPPPQQRRRPVPPPAPAGTSGQIAASYRAGSHGALVRCPQCQIQMRVLPHMYNMRVACPAGHMFLVQVAGQVPPGGLGGSGRVPPRGTPGYPGYH